MPSVHLFNFAVSLMHGSYKHIIAIGLLLIGLNSWAQKGLTTFGFSYKPMISGSLLNEGDPVSTEGNIEYRTDKAFGYSAGMVIRHSFAEKVALETGINFTRRNFDIAVTDAPSSYSFNDNFGVIAYGVPIQGLLYVQLSKQIFMDASFGGVIEMYPSDVAVFSDDGKVIMEGKRKEWIQAALTANLGWEYRTEQYGAFYIGATYHRSFGDAYGFLMEYDPDRNGPDSDPTTLLNIVNGNFLTIDLRYFFHVDADEQREKRNTRRGGRN